MSEAPDYVPGTPSWVDLSSPDPDASAAFYGALFGWEAFSAGPPEQTGGYRMFTLGGQQVAGLGPLPEGQPAWWTTYVTVADADETVAKAQAVGGRVMLAPMDVLDAGRMAVLADPLGAVFAIWQPDQHHGAAVVNEPGALCWNELACRDIEQAKTFYGAVFGWQGDTSTTEGMTYTEWRLAGRTIGGMIEMNEQWPPEVPPHWMVYFAVADCDATAARCTELGGKVSAPPTDIRPGRFAVLNDPHGVVFSVIQMAQPPAG